MTAPFRHRQIRYWASARFGDEIELVATVTRLPGDVRAALQPFAAEAAEPVG